MRGSLNAFNPLPGAKILWVALQREAWPLTLAAGIWLGMLGFFLWPIEPSFYHILTGLGIGLLLTAWPRMRGGGVFLIMIFTSALWAYGYVAQHTPPAWAILNGQSTWLVGHVQSITPQTDDPKRATLTLHPIHLFGVATAAQPPEIRLGVWVSQLHNISPQSYVAAPVKLLGPNGPQWPGQRDSRLWAWFNPNSSVAYAVGSIEPTADGTRYLPPSKAPWDALMQSFAHLRQKIIASTQRIGDGIPTALLVGEQKAISASVRNAYQAAGLSHLLAISGMQLTLVGLGVFWLLRWAGASLPRLALRYPIKLYAALGAMAVVLGYTLLTGASPSIVRAALMVGLVFIAVLAGRVRGILRAWALANILILAVQPHLAMSAGLQLSAAATFGLAVWAQTAPQPYGVWGWLKTSLWASVLAGAMTAPIAVLHFGMQPALGVLGNMVAIPLMTIASYMAFSALVLWPIGLENLALVPLTWFSQLTTAWAYFVADLQPQSVPLLPPFFALGLVGVAALTLVWMLARQSVAVLGLITFTAMGLLAWGVWAPRPTLILTENGQAAWRINHTPQGPSARLIWAEDPALAQRLTRRFINQGGKIDAANPQHPACCADAAAMPPTAPQFANAQQFLNGTWVIQPLKCSRRWQQASASCQDIE